MLETLEIGATPYGEDCAQVGAKDYDYYFRARKECLAFIHQLRRHAANGGVSLEGVTLKMRGSAHDFGTYYEVVAYFEDDDAAAQEAAHWLEADVPEFWDEDAHIELGLNVTVVYP